MSKKQGKSKGRFRHTKKNVLHKKRVNTKKRGLRGGAIDTRAIIDQQGLHGITGNLIPDFVRKTQLSNDVCNEWFNKIHNLDIQTMKKAFTTDGTLKTTSTGRKDYDICSKKLNNDTSIEQLKKLIQVKEQEQNVQTDVTQLSSPTSLTEVFNTELESNTIMKGEDGEPYYVGLTLDKCQAVRSPFMVNGFGSPYFEYSIYSPAASTEPRSGGTSTPNGTLVGTFTQLPVSFLLKMSGQETPFSYGSFYGAEQGRKPYFSDYISCLKNVQEKFGPNAQNMKSSQLEKFIPADSSSILRQFGKTPQCRILLFAGNVGTEIQKLENNGAIFVLPSQFNGAEYKYPRQAKIINLNNYKDDPTGGPLGQLSCHPVVATFILKYAARDGFTSSPFLVINAIDKVIEDLETLGITSLTLNNGYLIVPANLNNGKELGLTNTDSKNPSQNATAIFDSLSTRLKVLQTDDVPANGLTPPNEYTSFNSGETSKVSLVYASAVPLQYGKDINPEKSTLQYCVAGFDLVAQYFGAMVSAYYKSKKLGQVQVKLFLTPLGGGVFNNPREMIACSVLLAYYQAQQLLERFDDNVQVIFLVLDGNKIEVDDFSEFFNTNEEVALPKRVRPSAAQASPGQKEETQLPPAAQAQIKQDETQLPPEAPAASAASAPAPVEPAPAAPTASGAQAQGAASKEKTIEDYIREKELNENEKKKLIEDHKSNLESIQKKIAEVNEMWKKTPVNADLDLGKEVSQLTKAKDKMINDYESRLQSLNKTILRYKQIIYLIQNEIELPEAYRLKGEYMSYIIMTEIAELLKNSSPSRPNLSENENLIRHKQAWINDFNQQQEASASEEQDPTPAVPLGDLGGGHKSRRQHRHVHKTRRGRKSKSKPKTHRHRHHSRTRKHKKYTRKC